MSTLESDVRQVLIPLITGERRVSELESDARFLLARWSTKTAYILNRSSDYPGAVSDAHLAELYANPQAIPERVAVFGQQHLNDRPFHWLQAAKWSVRFPEGTWTKPEVNQDTVIPYKICFQFGQLLLLVAHWPEAGFRITFKDGLHVPLWPRDNTLAYYRSKIGLLADNSEKMVWSFLDTLHVTSEASIITD